MATETDVRDPGETVPGSRRLWTRLGTVLMVLVVGGTAVLSLLTDTEPPALSTVSPADGAVVGSAPTEVELTFAGTFEPREVHVTVADAAGRTVGDRPEVDGDVVGVPVVLGADGGYLVAYHIVLADGQVLAGQTGFRYTRGAVASAPPRTAPPAASGHSHGGDDPLSIGLTFLAAVLVAVMVMMMVRRPRPRA
ncbi:copper resistance protein CopC [Catellatospora sp. KI3]|uniref:copper resistance CopC family protein n=1 Tax=Catellatospora sp. KI3 TaxID=3041620 RepID=UPI0024830D8A|nr:copper resistance CopC family protein [Catellatospora sp. KI3]MDI1461475.1 copper resistance protein CopC [Catellatospora sp. KI3]